MTATDTHQTAETRLIDAGGVRFAYRRFGASGATPLVMLQHFRGNLDNWDPALADGLAAEREVILVDYPGAGSSSGEFGPTIADTARRMIAFLTALDLTEVDLLGFSIGGFVAQEIALIRPALVRRLVLTATGPKGAGNAQLAGGHRRARPDPGDERGDAALHLLCAHRHEPGEGHGVPESVHGVYRGPRRSHERGPPGCPMTACLAQTLQPTSAKNTFRSVAGLKPRPSSPRKLPFR
jgi:pimeloyl-ACP methyl ester carboxylesterase